MSVNRSVPPVREAREDEAPAIAEMLAGAFADDGVSLWLDPEPEGRDERSVGAFERVFAGDAEGMRLVTDDLSAASLWRRAGQDEAAGEAAHLPPGLPDRVVTMIEVLGAHRPREPHWYLHIAGCDAARKGEGLGTAVVQAGLERTGALPVYLETAKERNLAFYRKLGFAVTGEFDLPDGGPHMWSMLRPAP